MSDKDTLPQVSRIPDKTKLEKQQHVKKIEKKRAAPEWGVAEVTSAFFVSTADRNYVWRMDE